MEQEQIAKTNLCNAMRKKWPDNRRKWHEIRKLRTNQANSGAAMIPGGHGAPSALMSTSARPASITAQSDDTYA